jgi:hypothetical protein
MERSQHLPRSVRRESGARRGRRAHTKTGRRHSRFPNSQRRARSKSEAENCTGQRAKTGRCAEVTGSVATTDRREVRLARRPAGEGHRRRPPMGGIRSPPSAFSRRRTYRPLQPPLTRRHASRRRQRTKPIHAAVPSKAIPARTDMPRAPTFRLD